MKLRLAALAAVVAAAAVTTQPAAGAPSCRLPGGQTIATGRIAKLIELPTPDGAALYACIRRSGRKVALDISFADARIAGRWVAWQRRAQPHWRIDVHDLRSGHERLVDGHVTGDALFLTTTGTAVWAQRFGDSDVAIFANSLKANGRVLGRGAIDPASLHLNGRRVSWRAGGSDYTADVR